MHTMNIIELVEKDLELQKLMPALALMLISFFQTKNDVRLLQTEEAL